MRINQIVDEIFHSHQLLANCFDDLSITFTTEIAGQSKTILANRHINV